ncbi:RING-H2 finger protein [Nymphaea thermarum]|nr:RING-H2 finger protein [Nymphaea thermarum]
MDISCNATCTIQSTRPPEGGYDEAPPDGALFKIGFLLKDTLRACEGSRVTKTQCCYEQKIISIRYAQVQDMDRFQQVVYNVLHNDLCMDSQVATRAKVNVATEIRNKVLPTSNNNAFFWTYLVELHLDCTVTKGSNQPGPTGEHGFNRLLERISDDECSICADEFDSPTDIIVTTCHHTFDRACILQWLNQRSTKTCPTCRADLSTMSPRNPKQCHHPVIRRSHRHSFSPQGHVFITVIYGMCFCALKPLR